MNEINEEGTEWQKENNKRGIKLKIALSTKWKIVLISLIFWEIILLIAVVKVHIYGEGAADIIMIPCAVIITVCITIAILPTIRYLTYVIVTEDGFDSYLFKKKLCTVHKDKPIYYVIFAFGGPGGPEGGYVTRNYIVMSNEPFEYCDPTSIFSWKEPFLCTYDMKKQIAMLYDEKTMPFLEIEKWHAVHYSMF